MRKMILAVLLLGLALGPYPPHPSFAGHGNDQGDEGEHEQSDHGHKHKSDEHHKHHEGDESDQVMYSGPYFNAERVGILRGYYTPEEISKLPPGLRKHLERTGQLPPGIEKKLIREGQLPPEYQAQLVPVPEDLALRLGSIPADARLYMYNGDAILLNPKTQGILDIVHGVLELKTSQ
jgi:hypothetical protein